MKEMELKTYPPCQTLICDRTDIKKYLMHYRMLNFYVKLDIVAEKKT